MGGEERFFFPSGHRVSCAVFFVLIYHGCVSRVFHVRVSCITVNATATSCFSLFVIYLVYIPSRIGKRVCI